MMLAQFVLFDGFDPLDVIAPFEVFSAAEAFTDQVSAELACADGPREVRSGIPAVALTATARVDPDRADLIVVPGAAGRSVAPGEDTPSDEELQATIPAILGRAARSGLSGLLAQALATPDTTVATVCGGSLVLAMAGLISGRNATTHHQGLDLLGGSGVHAIRARVVDDGNLVTAGGVTSGLDLGLYLLERAAGPSAALAAEQLFEHERRGVTWHVHEPVLASA